MLNRLITTLRKRGAHGRTFPVQAAEATQAAELIAEQTGRPCSMRTVRAWLNDPESSSWRPCPDWAVLALETKILTLQLKQR